MNLCPDGSGGSPAAGNGHPEMNGSSALDASEEGWNVAGSEYLRPLAARLCRFLDDAGDRTAPTVRLASPDALAAAFDAAGVPLALPDAVPPVSSAALLAAADEIVRLSVNTAHPHFLNQLYGHCDPVSIGADWMTATLNTNVHTFEVAPVFTVVELAVLDKIARLVGPAFAASHEGLFVPGGSMANLYGMLLARYRIDPKSRTRGLAGGPVLVAFVSAHAHYSYQKAAIVLGLGTDNLIPVPCDTIGAMQPAALERCIAEVRQSGRTPFFVGATAGTTVTGAFDPLPPLADICQREGLWLHVDGAWGGAVLLSPAARPHLAGVDRADSLAFDAHKLVGLPVQCACFLARGQGQLRASHATGAAYLFQPDKLNASLDVGDGSIQCGRRNDALKLWMTWHAVGDVGLAARVDRSIALCQYWAQRVEGDPRFRLAVPLVLLNVCFWWLPANLRHFDPEHSSQAERDALGRVAPLIKARMQREGRAMIAFQSVDGRPNFFRAVVPGAAVCSTRDVDAILETIASIGEEVAAGLV
eukprot:EG_transcript_5857